MTKKKATKKASQADINRIQRECMRDSCLVAGRLLLKIAEFTEEPDSVENEAMIDGLAIKVAQSLLFDGPEGFFWEFKRLCEEDPK